MADSKKKSVKKVEGKKAPAKKGKKKLGSDCSFEIDVPRGGQVIQFFNLTPALPTATSPGDWIFSTPGSAVDISTLTVGFELNPSALERQFERAILVVSIQQNPATGGTWRFALGGVATDHGDENPYNDIAVEVIDNGFTLLVYVQALENNEENAPFGFVASYTDSKTGVVSIYESGDPIIIVDRPPKP
ncbi:DP-EP family protein [Cellvibrio sp. NN19]|uniref:DP-EP family protein n=1 Tax=Cellvibrio chitinivorans TaxID=3102792 RepID=UPI002B40AE07|nr:DP-EP family protein [Cellvibrio sp. NN19]